MQTIKMKPAGNTLLEKMIPLLKFRALREAIMKNSCNGIRDEIEIELINSGVSYNDITVNFTIFEGNNFYSLRTVKEPMPPALYKSVMKVFKEKVNWIYRKHNAVAAIRLSSEFPICPGLDIKDLEADDRLLPIIEFMQEQIEYIYQETKYWQKNAYNHNKFFCWPGKCAVTGKWCIYVSVHDDIDGLEEYGVTSDSEKVRNFIRSISEYESPAYCLTR